MGWTLVRLKRKERVMVADTGTDKWYERCVRLEKERNQIRRWARQYQEEADVAHSEVRKLEQENADLRAQITEAGNEAGVAEDWAGLQFDLADKWHHEYNEIRRQLAATEVELDATAMELDDTKADLAEARNKVLNEVVCTLQVAGAFEDHDSGLNFASRIVTRMRDGKGGKLNAIEDRKKHEKWLVSTRNKALDEAIKTVDDVWRTGGYYGINVTAADAIKGRLYRLKEKGESNKHAE